MHANANHGIPRIAVSAPAKREGEHTPTSKTVRRRRPQITSGTAIASEHVEGQVFAAGVRPAPLGHLSGERRIDEQEVVVARGRRPGRTGSRGWRAARARSGARLRSHVRAAAADELVRAEEHHEQRAERGAPVHVRPERRASGARARRGCVGRARLRREEPEEARVERQREHLGADRPRPARAETSTGRKSSQIARAPAPSERDAAAASENAPTTDDARRRSRAARSRRGCRRRT